MNASYRLAVLGNPDGWYVRDLERAAREQTGFAIEVVSFRDLQVQSESDGDVRVLSTRMEATGHTAAGTDSPSLCSLGDSFDGLLVRTMPLGSLEQVIFRMNALHVAEQQGLSVVNPPRTLEIAIDKWLTLDFARQAGIDIPRTICCQDRESALQAFETLQRDVVVKPLFGGEGRGIIRVNDLDVAWRVFSTLEQLAAVIYLQEFLPSRGYDLRILLVGDDAYCVARYGSGEEWRTNLSRGGKAVAHHPTEQQLDLARRAARAIGGTIVGVDLLPTLDGRNVLLEINAVPGWRGTAQALSRDIAGCVLNYLRSMPSGR